jgi:hypothetical protein
MPSFIKSGGIFRQALNIYVKQSGIWRQSSFVYVKQAGIWRVVFQRDFTLTVPLTIYGDTNDYSIHNAAVAAGWNGSDAISVLVTINAGVVVSASSVFNVAMNTGLFPVGSTISIVNNGIIQGAGGAGGTGGVASSLAPTNGQAGNDAMSLQYSVTIHNTNGVIRGGPGGGGGGDYAFRSCGSGKTLTNCTANGGNGGTGALSGGSAGAVLSCCGGGGNAGNGGAAGNWGAVGLSGTAGFGGGSGTVGTGGAAGKAVNLNGFTCNFTGGGSPPHVLGPVS